MRIDLSKVNALKAKAASGLYYDYQRQAWIRNGIVERCGHREPMRGCYACRHHGETVEEGGVQC